MFGNNSSATRRSATLTPATSDAAPHSPNAAEAQSSLLRSALNNAPLILAILSVAVALPHLLLGPNFVLDDWFNVQEGILGGLFSASTPELAASRPGMPIAYGLTFGLFGSHPLPLVVIASVVNVASAQVLFRTAQQYLARQASFALTGLWIVLPNHMALEIWPSTIMIAISLLLGLTAINLLGHDDPNTINRAAILIFAFASSAFYEGSLPMMCLAVLVVPKLRRGAFDLRLLAAGAISQGALAGWILMNLPPSKSARDVIALRDVLASFYGIGIVPEWFEGVTIVGFMVGFSLLAYNAVRERRFELPERLVVGGFVIMAAGIMPYLRYFYTAVGPGDRLQYMSSIGGAATIIGLLWAMNRNLKLQTAVRIVACVGLVLVVWTRAEGTTAWNQAGDDGITILKTIKQSDVDPLKPIVVGPEPVYHRGVTPFLDPSNVRPALAMLLDEPKATGFITFSGESFLDEPAGQRVDIRAALEDD